MQLSRPKLRWSAATAAAVVVLGLLAWKGADSGDGADEDASTADAAVAPRAAEAVRQAATKIETGGADAGAEPGIPALVRCQEAHRAALHQRTEALATRNDARSQLAFALLAKSLFAGEPRMSPQRASQAIARAVQLAPGDLHAAWLQALDCSERRDCAAIDADARLLEREPDNLAAWMIAIDIAVRDGRGAHAEALLQQAAASATHFDPHWADSNRLLLAALRPLPPLPACAEAQAGIAELLELDRLGTPDDLSIMSVHVLSTAQLPPLNGVFRLCPPRRALPRARLDACRAMYARLAGSAELLYRNVGVRGMVRHAATLEQRRQWREQLRDLAWLAQEGSPLLRGSHLPLVWERGEVPVMIALLEERERWPAPPRWLPRDRGTRLLIDPPPPPKKKKRRIRRRR